MNKVLVLAICVVIIFFVIVCDSYDVLARDNPCDPGNPNGIPEEICSELREGMDPVQAEEIIEEYNLAVPAAEWLRARVEEQEEW